MKKNLTAFVRSYWIIIWLILVSLALASFSGYAAYMRTQNAKRVVSTLGGAGNCFSSNRMDEMEAASSAFVFRLIAFQGEVPQEGISRQLTVCNYPQGMESSFYSTTIYYDLEVELTDNESHPPVFEDEEEALTQYYIEDESGHVHYFVKDTQSGRYLLTIAGESLRGNKASTKTYSLHFPDVDTNVYMKTFAEPKVQNGLVQSKPDDLRLLGAMISVGSVEKSQDTNWTGALVENGASGKTVSSFDAFNYVISGAGAGTITLKWKSDMLELNSYFGENEGITAVPSGPENGYMTLAFSVTASQTQNQYSFQMYKAKNSDWSTVSSFSEIANADNAGNPLIIFDFRAETQDQQQNQQQNQGD